LARIRAGNRTVEKDRAQEKEDNCRNDALVIQHRHRSERGRPACHAYSTSMLESREFGYACRILVDRSQTGFAIHLLHFGAATTPRIRRPLNRSFLHFDFGPAIDVLTAIHLPALHCPHHSPLREASTREMLPVRFRWIRFARFPAHDYDQGEIRGRRMRNRPFIILRN
jgi:hypothetical protein